MNIFSGRHSPQEVSPFISWKQHPGPLRVPGDLPAHEEPSAMPMMVAMTRHHPDQTIAALPWPRVRQRKQISFRERMWIRSLLDDGDSLRCIAVKSGRNVSVISREVSRNTRSSDVYDPLHADYTAEHRRKRPQQRKAARSPRLLARPAFDLSRGVGPNAWLSG